MNPPPPRGAVPRSLVVLHRVRETARKESHARLGRAEALRDEQAARTRAVAEAIESGARAVDPADLDVVTAWGAWRLRMELLVRREEARLLQRERDLAQARLLHEARVREELSVAGVIDAEVERFRLAERGAETRFLDEVGARRGRAA